MRKVQPMNIEITWEQVTSTVAEIDDADLSDAVREGVSLWDPHALGEWYIKRLKKDGQLADVLEDWSSRDAPEVTQHMVFGDPPEWYDAVNDEGEEEEG